MVISDGALITRLATSGIGFSAFCKILCDRQYHSCDLWGRTRSILEMLIIMGEIIICKWRHHFRNLDGRAGHIVKIAPIKVWNGNR
jgi:hypothetical protein